MVIWALIISLLVFVTTSPNPNTSTNEEGLLFKYNLTQLPLQSNTNKTYQNVRSNLGRSKITKVLQKYNKEVVVKATKLQIHVCIK